MSGADAIERIFSSYKEVVTLLLYFTLFSWALSFAMIIAFWLTHRVRMGFGKF